MMKYMLTATALVLILMVMWLPARTPPEIFEETALREALMLRTGEGIPMPETAANLAVEYLDGLVWVSGVPDRYTLRPYGGSPMTKDEFAEIGRAAERTTQTEWLRAMKSRDPAPCRHDRGHHRTHALHSRADCRRIRETPHPRSRVPRAESHLVDRLPLPAAPCGLPRDRGHHASQLSASVAFRLSRCVRPGRSHDGSDLAQVHLSFPWNSPSNEMSQRWAGF